MANGEGAEGRTPLPEAPGSDAERNRQIGEIIRDARLAQRRTTVESARVLGTSRGRLRDLELGRSALSALELERVVVFLGIPLSRLLPALGSAVGPAHAPGEPGDPRGDSNRLVLEARTGDTVRVIIDVRVQPEPS